MPEPPPPGPQRPTLADRSPPVASSAHKRWPRRIASLLVGVVLAAILLEAGLQVAAWWAFRVRAEVSSSHDPRDGREVILCIGDSFTFGLGADSAEGSYPSRLDAMLEQSQPGRYRVVNAGTPGNNSRDVLERLGTELTRCEPTLTLILIGTNDAWSLPHLLPEGTELDTGEDRFPWRWRTRRLLRLMLQPRQDARDLTSPLIGRWRRDELRVQFDRDGSLKIDDREFAWRLDGGVLTVSNDRGGDFAGTWSLREGKLRIDSVAFGGAIELDPDDGSVVSPSPSKDVSPDVSIEELRRRFATAPGRRTGEDLILALERAGQVSEAIEAAAELIKVRTDDDVAMRLLLQYGNQPDHRSAAIEALTDALAVVPPGTADRTRWMRTLANIQFPVDPRAALRQVLLAYREDSDRAATVQPLRRSQAYLSRELLEAVLADIGADDELAARVRVLYDEVTRVDGHQQVLATHLRRMVALCRAHGSRVLLLSYPRGERVVVAALAEVAAETGCDWLDVRPEFEQRLRTERYDSLFIPDGHLNDDGYRVLAGLVAEALRAQ